MRSSLQDSVRRTGKRRCNDSDRLWSYIGLEAVEPGDVIVQGGVSYRVRSSRAYWLGDAVHHWWALLEREREAAI